MESLGCALTLIGLIIFIIALGIVIVNYWGWIACAFIYSISMIILGIVLFVKTPNKKN